MNTLEEWFTKQQKSYEEAYNECGEIVFKGISQALSEYIPKIRECMDNYSSRKLECLDIYLRDKIMNLKLNYMLCEPDTIEERDFELAYIGEVENIKFTLQSFLGGEL